MKKCFYIVVFSLAFFGACSETIPSAFWKDFQKDFTLKAFSNNGPWGGYTAMHWTTKKEQAVSSKKVIDFANENGWELVDSSFFKADEVVGWEYSGNAVFPLSHYGFDPELSFIISTYNQFPRWINSDVKVYKFKTGLLTIYPGTDNSTDENGFVLINDKANEMSVYHLWGE